MAYKTCTVVAHIPPVASGKNRGLHSSVWLFHQRYVHFKIKINEKDTKGLSQLLAEFLLVLIRQDQGGH